MSSIKCTNLAFVLYRYTSLKDIAPTLFICRDAEYSYDSDSVFVELGITRCAALITRLVLNTLVIKMVLMIKLIPVFFICCQLQKSTRVLRTLYFCILFLSRHSLNYRDNVRGFDALKSPLPIHARDHETFGFPAD